jgi:hypothetical protein
MRECCRNSGGCGGEPARAIAGGAHDHKTTARRPGTTVAFAVSGVSFHFDSMSAFDSRCGNSIHAQPKGQSPNSKSTRPRGRGARSGVGPDNRQFRDLLGKLKRRLRQGCTLAIILESSLRVCSHEVMGTEGLTKLNRFTIVCAGTVPTRCLGQEDRYDKRARNMTR